METTTIITPNVVVSPYAIFRFLQLSRVFFFFFTLCSGQNGSSKMYAYHLVNTFLQFPGICRFLSVSQVSMGMCVFPLQGTHEKQGHLSGNISYSPDVAGYSSVY